MNRLKSVLATVLCILFSSMICILPVRATENVSAFHFVTDDTPMLQQDFSQIPSDWLLTNATVDNGAIRLGTIGGGVLNAYASPIDSSAWTDYVLEFDADFNQNFYRGISFRCQANQDDYLWWFGAESVQIIKRVSGSWTPIGNAFSPVLLSGIHSFRLVVNGSQFQTYVDGQLYNTATDSTLTAGGFRFFVNYDAAWFDNVTVTAIQSESEQVVPSGAIFSDDFSSSLNSWNTSLAEPVSGQLQLGTPGCGALNAFATPTINGNLTDYVLEFDADFNGHPYRGISFRRQDNGDDYLWWFGDNSLGVQVVKRVGGKWEPIGNTQPSMALQGTHRLRLEVEGASIRTYVDGQLCNTATDATLTSGGFLFFVNYDVAWIDNVVVTPIQNQPEGIIRAAMAVADITPSKPVYLQGYEGQSSNTLATPDKFTSDLKARILILDNGADRLVFVNLELISSDALYGDRNLSINTIDTIADICQTNRNNILLSNTHNHQAGMWLNQQEESKIIRAVQDAYSRLAPVKIGATTVNTQYGVSRAGNYTMDANAPYDNLMQIIRFDHAETGQPIGLIYSVPMHNTMLGNGQAANHNLLSCEFTGYASRAIEHRMAEQNPNFTAMHINGFYGNSGPLANGKWYARTVSELQSSGEAFAEEILQSFQTITTKITVGPIQTAIKEDVLPAHQTDSSYRKQFGDSDEMPLRITLGAIGNIGFVGVNYEPYSIIGARLKAESPYRVLIPAAVVNGWNGYLPTKEAVALHESGSYQAECDWNKTPFDAHAEEIFYEKVFLAVCDLADVDPVRVPMANTGIDLHTDSVEYVFQPDNVAALDKLVISFGQKSRKDCAQSFTLLIYDKADRLIKSKSYTDNSVNYLGEFLDGAKAAKVVLKVYTRYGNNASEIDQLQPQIWGIRYCTLPPYTETISTSTDYASFGGNQWQVTPKTVEAAIAPREKYTLALATSVWAPAAESGYSGIPTQLIAHFTNGDGLLDFQVKLAPGPIWGGAECEMLTITPTDAAYLLEKSTVVTGYIDIYWRGWTKMPFSVTIQVPTEECTHTDYVKFCCIDCDYFYEAAFRDATDLNGDGRITIFDAQMLAENRAGLRQLPNDRIAAVQELSPLDIVKYILGQYPTQQNSPPKQGS